MGAILYDTNVLIKYMRKDTLELDGSTTILNLIEFPNASKISNLKIIIPGKSDYDDAFQISIELLKTGTPVPAVDIIIATVALNRSLILHTIDKHFKSIKKIRKNLKIKYVKEK